MEGKEKSSYYNTLLIKNHTQNPCMIIIRQLLHKVQPRPISQIAQSAVRSRHTIQTQQPVQKHARAALLQNFCNGCVYGDEVWAREWDGLGLWGSSAGVVFEDDDHTVLGLTWDALGWPALVYLQTILIGSLWVIGVLIVKKTNK